MRYISDDNKVFNTIEECREHEENLKKQDESKKKEEYETLKRRYDGIVDLIMKWEDDYDEFIDKWEVKINKDNCKCDKKCETNKDISKTTTKNVKSSTKSSASKYAMDFSEFLDFLQSYFC